MPTVAMTRELDNYIDSLRSFLARNPNFETTSPKSDHQVEFCRTGSGTGSVQDQEAKTTPETMIVERGESYRRVQWKALPSTQKNYEALR